MNAANLSPMRMGANITLRKPAAILFTDKAGCGALSRRNHALALEWLEEHRQIMRGILPQQAGHNAKTGGGALLPWLCTRPPQFKRMGLVKWAD